MHVGDPQVHRGAETGILHVGVGSERHARHRAAEGAVGGHLERAVRPQPHRQLQRPWWHRPIEWIFFQVRTLL